MTSETQLASHLLRARLGKICVALTGETPAEMLEKAAVAARETGFVEFRLDYLSKPLSALPSIRQFLVEHSAVVAIATCRLKANGGRFAGSTAEAMEVLHKAAAAGFQIVDLELESAEKLARGKLDELRNSGAALIISSHDFHTTKDLDAVYARMQKYSPDFYKIVSTATKLSDNLSMIRFVERVAAESSVIGLCMGDPGTISRVLSLRAGSAFIFAAANLGEETAPGQIAARTLLETYRIDQVDVATKIYGVAGNPIKSSLSPLMLNTAFRRETVNAVYLAMQTAKVEDLFKLVKEIPIQGLSVTMPLKQDVIPFLERTDPLSARIGAVNTIFRLPDGKFYGFNTDVAGIVAPLERRMILNKSKILVLGAGGAARAAVFGLRDKGVDVHVWNRTPEAAQKLAKQSGAKLIKREAIAKTEFDAIVNATSAGMAGTKSQPILAAEELNCRLVFDLIYNPQETPLIKAARSRGIPVITGVEMFVTQGARQFEIWTGRPAPEEEMLRVVLHALRQSAEAAGEPPAPLPTVQRVETMAVAARQAALHAAAEAISAQAQASAPVPSPKAPVPAKSAPPAKPVPAARPVPAAAPVASAKPAVPAKIITPAKQVSPAKQATPKTAIQKTAAPKTSAPVKAVTAKAAPSKNAPSKNLPSKPKTATAKPVAKSTAKPVAKSTAKPVAKSTAKPVAKSTAKPVAKSTAKPVAAKQIAGKKSAVKPAGAKRSR
jgi:3-dehydroquinate dehydratase/shikimate dehydrogenase